MYHFTIKLLVYTESLSSLGSFAQLFGSFYNFSCSVGKCMDEWQKKLACCIKKNKKKTKTKTPIKSEEHYKWKVVFIALFYILLQSFSKHLPAEFFFAKNTAFVLKMPRVKPLLGKCIGYFVQTDLSLFNWHDILYIWVFHKCGLYTNTWLNKSQDL